MASSEETPTGTSVKIEPNENLNQRFTSLHAVQMCSDALESITRWPVLKRAFAMWGLYAVAAFVGAGVMGHSLVSVSDAMIGVPVAWLASWLSLRGSSGTSGAAIIVTALLVLIGLFAGAA